MRGRTIKYLATGAMLLCGSLAIAQTSYEKMEEGTVVTSGIERGTFMKPIPLPEGEWLVVRKWSDNLEFSRGSQKFTRPQHTFLLKNTQATKSPIYAMTVRFNPNSLDVNWGNSKCENANPKALVDDFGYTPNSTLYVCAVSWQLSNFKKRVAGSAESKNKRDQIQLSGLAAYPDDIPDNTLEVNVWGNKYRGTAIALTFLIERKGDAETDVAYASYVKDWVHATGVALGDTLINDKASIVQPAPYPAP